MNTNVSSTELESVLALNRASAFKRGRIFAPDLESAGRYAVAVALSRYDRTKGTFFNFAASYIRKAQILEQKAILCPVYLPANIYTEAKAVSDKILFMLPTPSEEAPDYGFLYRAIDALDGKLRVCVLEYYFDELTLKQIAKHCGVSSEAVRIRIKKALRVLKRLIPVAEVRAY